MFMSEEYDETAFAAFVEENVTASPRQGLRCQTLSMRDMAELYKALERPSELEEVFRYFCETM